MYKDRRIIDGCIVPSTIVGCLDVGVSEVRRLAVGVPEDSAPVVPPQSALC